MLHTTLLTSEGKFLARRSEAVDLSSVRSPVEQICQVARELGRKKKLQTAAVSVPGLVSRNGIVSAPGLPG